MKKRFGRWRGQNVVSVPTELHGPVLSYVEKED